MGDDLIIEHTEAIKDAIRRLKKENLVLKVEDSLMTTYHAR